MDIEEQERLLVSDVILLLESGETFETDDIEVSDYIFQLLMSNGFDEYVQFSNKVERCYYICTVADGVILKSIIDANVKKLEQRKDLIIFILQLFGVVFFLLMIVFAINSQVEVLSNISVSSVSSGSSCAQDLGCLIDDYFENMPSIFMLLFAIFSTVFGLKLVNSYIRHV